MQALKNLKPAAGGKISGPGTPTSDSIPAQIAETGEPLQVSNQERILSAKQEALLQQIAKLLGFESVDALLEAGTGEPVGPTIKGGKKAAATGMPPEESEDMTAQGTATKPAQSGLDAPWYSPTYARAANASEKTGLELERDRRAAGVAANLPKDDFMQTLLKTGATPSAPAATTPAATTPAATTPAAPTDAKQAKAAATTPAAPINSTPLDVSKLTPEQRSAAASAYGEAIDRATGTGPGAELARVGTDPLNRPALTDTMHKRFDAYKSNPDLLAMRNAREDLLGSGIRMERDANGGLMISNTGKADGAVPGGGASTINMKEGNEVMARANAIRQSMIDSQRGGVRILGGGGGGMSKERERLLATVLTPHKGAMNGQLTANQINAARGILSDAQSEHLKGAEIAQRGDEAAQRSAQEAARLAQGLPAMEGQQLQNEQGRLLATLQKKAVEGDEKALATWQAINSKEKTPRYTTHVVPGSLGEPATLVQTGPDGQITVAGTGGEITKQYAERAAKQQAAPRSPQEAAVLAEYKSGKITEAEARKRLTATGN